LPRLFLKSYANVRGSNPPNPLLGTPLLVTNLNSSTAQKIVNWVTTHDCRAGLPPTRLNSTDESSRQYVGRIGLNTWQCHY